MASKKITEMFAFTMDDGKGNEGIMGISAADGSWLPLVGADMARVNSLRPLADDISKHIKRKYRIMHFRVQGEVA